MDRRQLLHALNATGAGAVLPTWDSSRVDAPAIPAMVTLTVRENRAAVEMVDDAQVFPKIGLVSVGGMGSACLPRVGHRIRNLPYLDRTIAIDASSLDLSLISADHKILVGDGQTLIHSNEAEHLTQSRFFEIARAVAGLEMVLLIAGMAGNTGAEIAPLVARMLRHQGIATLGFAVMPFDGEGSQRQQSAAAGFLEFRRHSQALIPAFNHDLVHPSEKMNSLSTAALRAPLAVSQLCRSITNSIARTDLVGVDFKDIQDVILSQQGDCAFGFGSASGVNTATVAAQRAMADPMLRRYRLKQASAALVTIETPPQATMAVLRDAKLAMNLVRSQMPPHSSIFYGVTINPDNSDKFTVSILASGIQDA